MQRFRVSIKKWPKSCKSGVPLLHCDGDFLFVRLKTNELVVRWVGTTTPGHRLPQPERSVEKCRLNERY
jgi:hypothetical protein